MNNLTFWDDEEISEHLPELSVQSVQKEDDMKSKKELELELIPENSNLVRKRNVRSKKQPKILTNESAEPVLMRWKGDLDPFADTLQFMKYYRYVLHSKTEGRVAFNSMNSDSVAATRIMDVLAEAKRDKLFLDSWIRYFYDNNLKGEKALKPKYTSLYAFLKTFEGYNEKFHVPT